MDVWIYYYNHLGYIWTVTNWSWSLFYVFCLFVVCASYVSTVVKISCGAHPQHHGATSRERKLTKTLLIVTVVSLLLWLPYTIFTVLSFYLPSSRPPYPVSSYLFTLSSFCFLKLPLQSYMQSECQTLKQLPFHFFDVSKDKLRLFPSASCDY